MRIFQAKTKVNLHGHSKGTLLRVRACKGEPSDVQRVSESSESLGEDHAEVAETLNAELGKDAVEDVGQRSKTEGDDDSLAATITGKEVSPGYR